MRFLNIKTENTNPFKLLIEVLKEILMEANIEIRGNTQKTLGTDDSYFKIRAVDPTVTVYIYLKLDGKAFNMFECKTKDNKPVTIGVNLTCFHKLIKSMDKDDCLTLYMDNDNMNCLNIEIDSSRHNKKTTYDLKLLELGRDDTNLPNMKFDAVIIINSVEFHKLCKEMSAIADLVEITCYEKRIEFSCKGDYANRKTTFCTASSEDINKDIETVNIKFDDNYKKNVKVVQGIYELKHLALFAKCAQLCETIKIHMKVNKPLVIAYSVASLGRVLLCLSPVNDESSTSGDSSNPEVGTMEHYDTSYKLKGN